MAAEAAEEEEVKEVLAIEVGGGLSPAQIYIGLFSLAVLVVGVGTVRILRKAS